MACCEMNHSYPRARSPHACRNLPAAENRARPARECQHSAWGGVNDAALFAVGDPWPVDENTQTFVMAGPPPFRRPVPSPTCWAAPRTRADRVRTSAPARGPSERLPPLRGAPPLPIAHIAALTANRHAGDGRREYACYTLLLFSASTRVAGPMPTISRMHSASLGAVVMDLLARVRDEAPAGNGFMPWRSYLGPVFTNHVPASTVMLPIVGMKSGDGCVCAASHFWQHHIQARACPDSPMSTAVSEPWPLHPI